MSENIVTFRALGRYGRLANQMFQLSGLIGIARKNGFDFALTDRWRNHDGRNFEPDLDIDVFERFENELPIYTGPDLPQRGIPWGYHDVVLTQSSDLLGHFQSERYFEHALDEVRFYLRMKDEPPQNDYCAIHWRAGDYGNQPSPQHPDGNPWHPRMELSYYEPAMSLFGSDQKFLVFSDDIPAARKMFGDRCEYSTETDYLNDWRLMKRCSHFIIANSSYSLMAAILGENPEKQVFCPRPWFGAAYKGQLDESDIPSPGWHIVDWETQEIKRAA